MCELYNIPFQEPVPLSIQNGWFSGFFDADGTVGFSIKKGWPQLVLSVGQKDPEDLLPFKDVFGGFIRLDSKSNTYKWDLYREESIIAFVHYLKSYPLQGNKKNEYFY